MAGSLDNSLITVSDVSSACSVSYFFTRMQCVVLPATEFPPSYRRATVMHVTCASLVFCGMSTLQDQVPGLWSATRRLTINWLWEIRGAGSVGRRATPADKGE
jgi:hypothetical protein